METKQTRKKEMMGYISNDPYLVNAAFWLGNKKRGKNHCVWRPANLEVP
jgi:hypothetical protein